MTIRLAHSAAMGQRLIRQQGSAQSTREFRELKDLNKAIVEQQGFVCEIRYTCRDLACFSAVIQDALWSSVNLPF